MSDAPVGLFYSYAHEDEPYRDELAGHLKILERRGLIQVWHDRKIVAGQDWNAAIDGALDHAELVLLLLSKDFIESDYIFGVELKRAMQRQQAQACEVVPILVRAIDIDPEDAEDLPFMKLQALPTDLKAVTSWANRDEAWTNVAKGLRATVRSIRERRRPVAAPERPAAPAPVIDASRDRPAFSIAGTRPPASAGDAMLDQVIGGVMAQIDAAERQRSGRSMIDRARFALHQGTQHLIDMPEQKRVLWVDDAPQNNRYETAALAKLQIEVVAVRSTAEAMARVAADRSRGESFDLVLSDWSRPADGDDAMLGLLRALRAAGQSMPLVCYHGEADPARRAARAARALAEGCFGEAVAPAELMALIERALVGRS